MSYDRQLTMLVEALEQALRSKLGDAEKAVKKECAAIRRRRGRMSPKMGSQVSVSCLVANGLESHAYTRGERFGRARSHWTLAARRRGPILHLVGHGESFRRRVRRDRPLGGTNCAYVDKYAVPKMNEEERATYAKAMERLRPLGRTSGSTKSTAR